MPRSLLPQSLFARKKEGFNAPIQQWVQKNVSALHDELIGNATPELKKWINLNVVETWLSSEKAEACW